MDLVLSTTDHLNSTYTREDGTLMYKAVSPLFSHRVVIKKAIPESQQGTATASTQARADPQYAFLAQVDFHAFRSSVFHINGEKVKTSEFFESRFMRSRKR